MIKDYFTLLSFCVRDYESGLILLSWTYDGNVMPVWVLHNIHDE